MAEFSHIRKKWFMLGIFKATTEDEDNSRKDSDGADNAQDNTFGHDETKIEAKGKGHEHEGNKTGDSGNGRTEDGAEGFFNGGGHGSLAIFFGELILFAKIFLLFFEAVPEEDRIIHGDGELENGGEGFRNEGDFAEEDIGAKVDENHDTDAGNKDEWGAPVV